MSISVATDNPVYDSRNNCNAVIQSAENTLIVGCQNSTIPDSVTSIGDGAFAGCSSLLSIRIPDNVTSIGGYAFSGCEALAAITIPNRVAVIHGYAFASCTNLNSMVLPGSLLSLGNYVFSGCTSLESIHLPRHFETTNLQLGCPSQTEVDYYNASTLQSPIPVSFDWLDSYPAVLNDNENNYEKSALAVAANGINYVWECYLAGLNPTNPESRFVVSIKMKEGDPSVSWNPDLRPARRYTIEGKTDLAEEFWRDNRAEPRFFRAVVFPPKAATSSRSSVVAVGDFVP